MEIKSKPVIDALEKAAGIIGKYGGKILIGAGIAVGGAAAVDSLLLQGGDRARSYRQVREQERYNRKQDKQFKKINYAMPQELYSYKTGHSNTWGGKKY
jgi:hypothetical protein